MGDTSRHLTYFKVENFKRFESFEMKDLGQFNLIVGDNNVGKTSVLEALLVDDFSLDRASHFIYLLNLKHSIREPKYRDLFDVFCNKSNKLEKKVVSFEMKQNERLRNVSWTFDSLNKVIVINDTHDKYNQRIGLEALGEIYEFGIPYINPFYRDGNNKVTSFYSENIQRVPDVRRKFLKGISLIIHDLESIEPYNPTEKPPDLIFIRKSDEVSMTLDLFGDGTINFFRILLAIIGCKRGGRVMIDEIDAGIYYKKLKDFLKVILQTAHDNDVQLFMTTHNEECIKYFKEVLEEDLPELQKDVRNITLVENSETKEVTAHTFDYDQFEHAINMGNEIRG